MNSKSYFNVIATEWDSMQKSFFSDNVREQAYQTAALSPGLTAADIGAGTGFITEGLLKRGITVLAVDQSPEMLRRLEKKFGPENLRCLEGSAEHLPVSDNSANRVFANMFLHHTEDPLTAISEMARILKPGGMLVITDLEKHHHEFLRTEQYDRWLGFDPDDVSAWMKQAGLEQVSVRPVNESCCGSSACGCREAVINIWIASGVKP